MVLYYLRRPKLIGKLVAQLPTAEVNGESGGRIRPRKGYAGCHNRVQTLTLCGDRPGEVNICPGHLGIGYDGCHHCNWMLVWCGCGCGCGCPCTTEVIH